MCPARELARQTYDAVTEMTDCLARAGEPPINVVLVMGQVDVNSMMRCVMPLSCLRTTVA